MTAPAAPPAGPFATTGRRRLVASCGVLLVALLASVILGTALGPVSIRWQVAWQVIVERVGLPVASSATPVEEAIVWGLRLPRVLLGALVGAGLAVVGTAVQALARNALADPYVLGISSGASMGATAVLLFGTLTALGSYAVSAGAFLGGVLAIVVVYAVAQRDGQLSPLRLVLTGVAMAYAFSALSSLMIFESRDPNAVRSVLHWLLGSLAEARWSFLGLPALAVALGLVFLLLAARPLNALLMGDDSAAALGVDVTRFRRQLFLVAALVTSLLVAVSGAIGFVGLMIPHLVRLVVGPDHRRVLPVAALLGAVFMIWADVLARLLVAPEELPVGVITALVGVPFFVWLMRSSTLGIRGTA
ncbi:MAG: FecCD family ABC transporter permease [Pseudonocardiales bacterium]